MAETPLNISAPLERTNLVSVPAPDPSPEPVKADAPPRSIDVAPVAVRLRHWGMLIGFILVVIVPTLVAGWYMWARAADRYVSTVAFSVRTPDSGSALQLLSGVANFSGSSSSSDTDILYQFIQSQELVSKIDAALDLRKIWSKGDPEVDPVFAYHPPGTIEDLMSYWPRMVKVYNDSGTGILNVEVQAFTPEDARMIAQMIFDDSSQMINTLSAVAHDDATRYARQDRDEAVDRLKTAREAMTRFRNRTQIVDPAANVQNQMGLLSSLQTQLAETLINLGMLKDTVADTDPRIVQAERRIDVIRDQIAEERRTLGLGAGAGDDAEGGAFADLVGEYERLAVDLQFAEQAYTAAMASYDAALAESRRQSRYLAAHVQPTLAESSEQPSRITIVALVALFAFLSWAVAGLIFYSIRDRR